MKKSLFCVFAMLFAGSANSANAAVTTLDFNSITLHPTNHEISVAKPYLEDGFKLTTLAGVSFQLGGGTIYAIMPSSPYWTGSVGLYSGVVTNQGSAFLLEKQDGGTFDLLSMDAASFGRFLAAGNSLYMATRKPEATSASRFCLTQPQIHWKHFISMIPSKI